MMGLLHTLFLSSSSLEDKLHHLANTYDIMVSNSLQKEVHAVCNLSQGILQQGRKEGLEEGITKCVIQLMSSNSISLDEAFRILNVDTNLRSMIQNMIKQKEN